MLDLDYQRSAVVGTRAFEGDPERAALLAGAFIRGMNSAGMAATGKHFPGHGWAEADSHVAIPWMNAAWSSFAAMTWCRSRA